MKRSHSSFELPEDDSMTRGRSSTMNSYSNNNNNHPHHRLPMPPKVNYRCGMADSPSFDASPAPSIDSLDSVSFAQQFAAANSLTNSFLL